MTKLTEWFKPGTTPVRNGVYQVADETMLDLPLRGYQYWNGEFWGRYSTTTEEAAMDAHSKSLFQRHYWRGLAEPSK